MDSRQLEGTIKSALAQYRDEVNTMNEANKIDIEIDFNLLITKHWVDPKDAKRESFESDEVFNKYKKRKPQNHFYMRLTRFHLVEDENGIKSPEKGSERLVYQAYRPEEDFKKKVEDIKKSLLKELLFQLIKAGAEYSELVYLDEKKKFDEHMEGINAQVEEAEKAKKDK